ncbi:MAG: nickel pincer cofactor biosynthesis protein LarC [Clostridia bacterium]|nr:nickel pincer cofactor biosynthesis protein LarC [Clostridia bacterium]
MKTLYLDCGMGAAGDMLTAALLELLPDKDAFVERLNSLGIPGVEYQIETTAKCGINGTHMHVLVNGEEEAEFMHQMAHAHGIEHHHHDHEHEHHHHDHGHEHHHDHEHEHHHHHDHDHEHEHHHHHSHNGMHEIGHIIEAIKVSDKVKADIKAVYGLIAEAESHAHGVPADQIHFHEVGTMDAVADVTAVCLLMDEIGADNIIASPVHVGSGHVHCAHGVLPVPAPATAYILKDVPIYGGRIKGELCTPTGAALLKHFVNSFGDMPAMAVKAIGYGMGYKDFEQANCVRAMLGEPGDLGDCIAELNCNIDDMTGEEIGHAANALMEAGARDVFTTAVTMKKNRPGILLTVICTPQDCGRMAEEIFKNTTTIGIRKTLCDRYILSRREEALSTSLGEIRRKVSEGYGVKREKIEYCDVAQAAEKAGISMLEAKKQILKEI